MLNRHVNKEKTQFTHMTICQHPDTHKERIQQPTDTGTFNLETFILNCTSFSSLLDLRCEL